MFEKDLKMTKKIVISERDSIAAVMENNKVSEFFISKGDVLLGDVYQVLKQLLLMLACQIKWVLFTLTISKEKEL